MVVDVPVGIGASSADFQAINMFANKGEESLRIRARSNAGQQAGEVCAHVDPLQK